MSVELLKWSMENEHMRVVLADMDLVLKARLAKSMARIKAGREPVEFVEELAAARQALRTIDDALMLGADLPEVDADGRDTEEA